MRNLLSGLTNILFDPPPRRDRVTLALAAIDAVTGAPVRHGISARIDGLPVQPIVGASGMLVFVNLPDRPSHEVEIDGRRAGFPFVERLTFVRPAAGDGDPAARRRDVLLLPGPDYPFAPGTTLVRGVVRRGETPVEGARISAALGGGGVSFEGRSVANGAFAIALRLPPSGSDEAEAPVPVTIHVVEGADARSLMCPVVEGRCYSFMEPIDLSGGADPGPSPLVGGQAAPVAPGPADPEPAPPPPKSADPNILSDYVAEFPALKAAERELENYRHAEIALLERLLPAETRDAVAAACEGPEREIAELRARIDRHESDAAYARIALADARRAAAETREKAEMAARGGAAIRDRIGRAGAVRAEARKASAAGRYALAYWLVRPGGKLDRAIHSEPALVPPDELRAAIAAAAAAHRASEESVAALIARVEALDAALRQDRMRLAELERCFDDAAIRAELEGLDPPADPDA